MDVPCHWVEDSEEKIGHQLLLQAGREEGHHLHLLITSHQQVAFLFLIYFSITVDIAISYSFSFITSAKSRRLRDECLALSPPRVLSGPAL